MYKKACLYCYNISGGGSHRGSNLTRIGNRLIREKLKIRIANGEVICPYLAELNLQKELNGLVSFLETGKDSNSNRK